MEGAVRTVEEHGHTYTASNHRLRYDPLLHPNRGKAFTTDELIYLCGMWATKTRKRQIALALERTEGACMSKVYTLKSDGEFDSYVQQFQNQIK